jgi:cysteine-rich repeat protein
MRWSLCALGLAALSGCASDPCAGEPGSCITAHLKGNAKLDQLAIAVDQPIMATQRTPTPPATVRLPAALAIVLPAGTTGPVDVRIDGYAGSELVASDEHVVTLSASGRASQTFTLVAGSAVDDMANPVTDDGGDLGSICDGPCPVTAVCGNGLLEAGEACDDGNTLNGDTCDPTCQFHNVLSRIAGHPDAVLGGYADGVGAEARFRQPAALTTDGTSLYVGDNCSVRMIVNPAGLSSGGATVSTLAGLENDCQTMDGIGGAARFLDIQDIQWVNIGAAGTLFIATPSSLRRLDLATKQVTTMSVAVGDPNGVGTDGNALLLVDGTNGARSLNIGSGAVTPLATEAQINKQCSDIVYNSGYFIGCGGFGVLQIVPGTSPTITTLAGGGSGCSDNAVGTMAGIGSTAHLDASMGVIYFSDPTCHAIRQVASTGAVTTTAGTLGTQGNHDDPANPKLSTFDDPEGIGVIVVGITPWVFIAEKSSYTVRYKANGTAILAGVHHNDGNRVFGADPVFAGPAAVVPFGDSALVGSVVVFGTAETAKVNLTTGAATDFNATTAVGGPSLGGFMYGSGSSDFLIYKVPLDGTTPTLFAGTPGQPTNTAMDGAREIAILHALSVVTDGTDLYFADTTNTIRKIDMMSGNVSTIAGEVTAPVPADGVGLNAHFDRIGGMTIANGYIYLIDGGGSLIRKLKIADRTVSTIAGKYEDYGAIDGVGTTSRFGKAVGIATNGTALFITDPGNGWSMSNVLPGDGNGPTVRELVLSTGDVSTMIGTRGQWTFRAGVGTNARLNWPVGIAFDPMSKTLLVTDYSEEVLARIR